MAKLSWFIGLFVIVIGVAASSESSTSTTPPTTERATSRITTPPGCSPITITTSTVTTTVRSSVNHTLVTQTPTTSVYIATIRTTITTTSFRYKFKSTLTTTISTIDSTTVLLLPYKATVTGTRPSVFTPILCQTQYHIPFVTVTATSYDYYPNTTFAPTSTITYYQTTTTISHVRIATYTYDSSVSYDIIYITPTSTVTRGTRTQSPACATLNIARLSPLRNKISGVDFPYGGTPGNVNFSDPSTSAIGVEASNELDCCELCQAFKNCTGSVFFPGPKTFRENCSLFYSRKGVCDQKDFIGEIADIFVGDIGGFMYYISNGPCGQFGFKYI